MYVCGIKVPVTCPVNVLNAMSCSALKGSRYARSFRRKTCFSTRLFKRFGRGTKMQMSGAAYTPFYSDPSVYGLYPLCSVPAIIINNNEVERTSAADVQKTYVPTQPVSRFGCRTHYRATTVVENAREPFLDDVTTCTTSVGTFTVAFYWRA